MKYTVVGTVLGPALTIGMPAIGPGVSQALFSVGHQHRPAEVRSQDCGSHARGPAVGAMEAAQTLAWPNRHVYVPTKPTAAKARPISATEALVIHADILQALNLQSRQCGSVNRWFVQPQGEISALLP